MANPPPPRMPAPPPKQTAPWRVKLGKAVPWLFWLFAAGGLAQVYLAGYGIENLGDQGMDLHKNGAHVVEMIPLLIILVAFLGADYIGGVGGIALLGMYFGQYFSIDGVTYAPVLALHAANGVGMIILAVVFALRRRRTPTPAAAARPAAATPTRVRAVPTVPGRPPQPPAL